MGNLIKNAGLLDGVTNYTALASGALSVDETTVGAPGRAVIRSTATGSGTVGLRTASVAVAASTVYDAFGRWEVSAGTAGLSVEWLDGAQASLSETALPLVRAAAGPGYRGVPSQFAYSYGRVTSPVGAAFGRLKVATALPGSQAYAVSLLKPFLGIPTLVANRLPWDPGPHDNADLSCPAWPHDLPPVQWDGYSGDPTPSFKGFTGDTGVPQTDRIGVESRFLMKGAVRCSPKQVEQLRQFFRTAATPFFFVRPDTDELCFAQWAEDGEPRFAELTVDGAVWTFGLTLAVA